MSKLPISVCLISGAEAHRIGQALESVAGWTSEIIVVLNEDVRDGTEEIARHQGARVFREPWKGHIAQKNSAAAKATQPWILGLDADEVVSPELREEILRLFARPGGAEPFVAYSCPRCTLFCGRWIRHGDWYPDRQTRLWRRGRAEWRGIDPHDKLWVDGPVGRLRGELLHQSVEDLDRLMQKISVYGNYFAKHWLAQGRKPGVFDFLARPLWRFMRCYFLRLGFLDGWVGFYLAWQTAFACLTRYAKVQEALTAAAPPPARSSCSMSPSSSSRATRAG
jgi:glycosyltransferase involved in cell wall biosynthesis